jgi:fumarylpyruvate hydrolase
VSLVVPAPRAVTIPIVGEAAQFPVRRVYCVGQNYLAHALEMGADGRQPPFFFSKFADSIVLADGPIDYPTRTQDFHFEGELVVAIGAHARTISAQDALSVVYGYACGLDMTRRDMQSEAKAKSRPWDMSKNFSQSGVIAPITRAAGFGDLAGRTLNLSVNGQTKQESDLALMIWSVAEIIADLSTYDTLEAGDLIFTGTPAGVGPVVRGDKIRLTIDGLTPLEVGVA